MIKKPDPIMANLLQNLQNVSIGKPPVKLEKPSSQIKQIILMQLTDEKEGLKVLKQIYSMDKTSENLKKCFIPPASRKPSDLQSLG